MDISKQQLDQAEPQEVTHEARDERHSSTEQSMSYTSSFPGLRRRTTARMETEESSHEAKGHDSTVPVKLDASALAHIKKHSSKCTKKLDVAAPSSQDDVSWINQFRMKLACSGGSPYILSTTGEKWNTRTEKKIKGKGDRN